MDELRITLFESGVVTWGSALGVVVSLIGLRLRQLARRDAARIDRLRAGRRPLADLAPGAVTVEGTWRSLGTSNTRGLIEASAGMTTGVTGSASPRATAVVERDDPFPFSDGDTVTLSGYVARREPLAAASAGYRDDAGAWLIDARGHGELCERGSGALDQRALLATRRARIGATLFAAGLALCVTIAIIAARLGDG